MTAMQDGLLQHPLLWRGERSRWTGATGIASGYAELDAHLPGGGWLPGTLTEILVPKPGIGELQLLMPALLRLNKEQRWIVLIAPPHIPYAPALQANGLTLSRLLWVRPRRAADQAWAIEQALRTGTCSTVLCWPTTELTFQQLRRFQLAAEKGQCWGILFRSTDEAHHATPAATRVELIPQAQGLTVHLLKCRGVPGGGSVDIPLVPAGDPIVAH